MNGLDDPILQYKVARELFNTRIAECSARLAEEEAKASPDETLVEAIEQEQLDIALERSSLQLTNPA